MSDNLISDNSIFTEASSSSGGSTTPNYLVYTALLSQTGTNAPVPTVLENTIGAIVWSYVDVGKYRANLIGAFDTTKTFVILTGNGAGDSMFMLADNESNDYCSIGSVSPTSGYVNGYMFSTYIEIRVYN
jgi:hypothetical protein